MASPSKKKPLNPVEFRSILRIRPFLGKERDDQVVLEPLDGGFAVALHPPVVKEDDATFLNALVSGQDLEFKFDRVLSKETNQEKTYSVIALPMALLAMDPIKSFSEQPLDFKSCKKNQLLICMGLPNSGSSFTCTGPLSNKKNDSDGLLPRLFESLFLQCHHNVAKSSHKSFTFGVNFTAVQVNQSKKNSHECHLYDLVKPTAKSSTVLSIFDQTKRVFMESTDDRRDKETASDTPINAFPVFCSSAAVARDCLKAALQRARQTSQKKFQSHLFISVQPLLVSQNSGRILCEGGNICFLEMAGFDSKQRATRSREPSCLDAHSAVMHCLKAVRHNQISLYGSRKIPYLQHKVTALLMPLCPLKTNSLSITLLVTASPSIRDYSDKKILLSEVSQFHVPPPTGAILTGLASISNLDELPRTAQNQSRIRHGNPEEKFSIKNTTKRSTLLSGDLDNLRPPLPPPIAPGFTERNDHLIDPCCTEATAPVEAFTESTPGKSEKCLKASCPIAGGIQSSSPIPLANAYVGSLLPESRFNYLNTINKIVHVSKKKGLDNPRHSEERVSELEKQTQQLLSEIYELKLRNQELEDCIHSRGDSVSMKKPLTSRIGSENTCNFVLAGSDKWTEILNKGDSHKITKFIEEINFIRKECSIGLTENSLVQNMTKIGGENKSSINDSQNGFCDRTENHNNENFLQLDHGLSNSGMTTILDDQLIQHMARMNK